MTQIANPETVADVPKTKRDFQLQTPLDKFYWSLAQRLGGSKAREVERFLRFATVGIIGATVDFGTLNVLLATVLPPDQQINVAIATTVAFIAAVSSNFFWNRIWTYPDSRTRSVRRQLVQFTLVSVVGWLSRTLWITLSYLAIGALAVSAIQLFSSDFALGDTGVAKLGTNIAQFFGVFVVMIWNFFANRYWTYNDVE